MFHKYILQYLIVGNNMSLVFGIGVCSDVFFRKDTLSKSKFQAISLSQLGVFTNDFLTFLMAHVFLYCPRNFK